MKILIEVEGGIVQDVLICLGNTYVRADEIQVLTVDFDKQNAEEPFLISGTIPHVVDCISDQYLNTGNAENLAVAAELKEEGF